MEDNRETPNPQSKDPLKGLEGVPIPDPIPNEKVPEDQAYTDQDAEAGRRLFTPGVPPELKPRPPLRALIAKLRYGLFGR